MALAIVLAAAFVPPAAAKPVVAQAGRAPYVLRFAADATAEERARVLSAAGAQSVGEIELLRLAKVLVGSAGATLLGKSSAVEWIHPESRSRIAAARPNDPLLDRQWSLKKTRAFAGWAVEDGKAAESVVVAVADTGVDPSHPDLEDRVLPGLDLVNGDRDAADDHGHGTHVAGVIAARSHNRRGIAGLSWGAKVMPLKVCDISGGCDNFLVVASIVWAIQHGAKVVNLSLGGPGDECPPEYELARDLADRNGVLLVAAAGNSGFKGGENPVNYPAACDGFLSVGATGPQDEWASFSTHNPHVDVSAPGVQIVSTLPPALTMQDDPATHGYGPADGTSMACPHVAGLAALVIAQNPQWSPAQVQERIEETSVDLGKPGRDDYFGAGRIDVAGALGVSR